MSELGRKLIAAVREAAKKRPKRTSHGAYYQNGDFCILGDAMNQCGVAVPQDLNGTRFTSISSEERIHIGQIWGRYGLRNWTKSLDADEVLWLQAAQDSNDNRMEWERCVSRADYIVPNVVSEPEPQQPVRVEYHPVLEQEEETKVLHEQSG